MSFFTAISISCQQITTIERISLLVELKKMLHPYVFLVKN